MQQHGDHKSGPSSLNCFLLDTEPKVWLYLQHRIGHGTFSLLSSLHSSHQRLTSDMVMFLRHVMLLAVSLVSRRVLRDIRELYWRREVYFFLVEGAGRTLEEIDTMYLENVSPRKSSKWVPPSAEEMAQIRKQAGTDETMLAADVGNDVEQRGRLSGDTERGIDGDKQKHEQRHAEHAESVVRWWCRAGRNGSSCVHRNVANNCEHSIFSVLHSLRMWSTTSWCCLVHAGHTNQNFKQLLKMRNPRTDWMQDIWDLIAHLELPWALLSKSKSLRSQLQKRYIRSRLSGSKMSFRHNIEWFVDLDLDLDTGTEPWDNGHLTSLCFMPGQYEPCHWMWFISSSPNLMWEFQTWMSKTQEHVNKPVFMMPHDLPCSAVSNRSIAVLRHLLNLHNEFEELRRESLESLVSCQGSDYTAQPSLVLTSKIDLIIDHLRFCPAQTCHLSCRYSWQPPDIVKLHCWLIDISQSTTSSRSLLFIALQSSVSNVSRTSPSNIFQIVKFHRQQKSISPPLHLVVNLSTKDAPRNRLDTSYIDKTAIQPSCSVKS